MSLDASLHVIVPVSELDAAIESVRTLGRCVTDPEDLEEYGTLFQLQMKKTSGSPKTWYADVSTSSGTEFGEVEFVCAGTKDAMALFAEKTTVPGQIAAALEPHQVVCGQILVDGEPQLLDGNLKPAKKTLAWPAISTGGKGADNLARAYREA